MKNRLLIILTLVSFSAFSQEITLDLRSYASSGDNLPFWFTSNQRGVFTQENSTYQLGQLELNRSFTDNQDKTWDFTYGTNLVYGLGKSSQTQINQYFAGIRYKKLALTAGAQSDPVYYGGLSSTNGNMFASRNARPLPGIKIASHGWIKSPVFKDRLSFRFAFEEQLCDNDRIVQDAHLHHKNLYFRYKNGDWTINAGVEHYSFWGGYHPKHGQLPEGFGDYIRGITGMAGGSNSIEKEQINVAGNQLGTYILQIERQFTNSTLTFYWNHLFEDRSGMEMQNWRDGLWGLHWKSKNNNKFITQILYEFMYTKHQSGSKHLQYDPQKGRITGRGKDDYFNHYIYKSGYIYKGMMIGSPLFIPNRNDNNTPIGFSSTRMRMHHIGIKGFLNHNFKWKGLLTYTRNFGTYDKPFSSPLNQFSFLLEGNYKTHKLPFDINAGIAGDSGDRFHNRIGMYVRIMCRL